MYEIKIAKGFKALELEKNEKFGIHACFLFTFYVFLSSLGTSIFKNSSYMHSHVSCTGWSGNLTIRKSNERVSKVFNVSF